MPECELESSKSCSWEKGNRKVKGRRWAQPSNVKCERVGDGQNSLRAGYGGAKIQKGVLMMTRMLSL